MFGAASQLPTCLAIWSLITFHFILFGLGVVFIDIVFTALLAAHILLVRRYYDHGHAPELAETLHPATLRGREYVGLKYTHR